MRIVATDADAGLRLDQWLTSCTGGLSRSQVQRLIRDGMVTTGGGPVKASLEVTPGLTVDVTPPEPVPSTVEGEDLPLTILYEDEDIVVVNGSSSIREAIFSRPRKPIWSS